MLKHFLLLTAFVLFFQNFANTQSNASVLKELVQNLKSDTRGPYKDIRWFCPDGSIIAPKEKCNEPGGFQRARYKDKIVEFGEKEKLYLGQILSGTEKDIFYDLPANHSRMKQYVLENYLYGIDDGWIQQKSKYYRGAVQVEDEESWGRDFLTWTLESSRFQEEQFFLIRELVKHLPNGEQNNTLTEIRNLSKIIADRTPSFMDIRTKIHGNPQSGDMALVKNYLSQKMERLSQLDQSELNKLIRQMEKHYQTPLSQHLLQQKKKINSNTLAKKELDAYTLLLSQKMETEEKFIRSSDMLSIIKLRILDAGCSSKERLTWMNISILIEQNLFTEISSWSDNTIQSFIKKSCYLAQISNATGHIFDWEFDELLPMFTNHPVDKISFEQLYDVYKTLLRNINWGSAMLVTEFGAEVDRFSAFEPLAEGFMDDRIRSSALLYLGQQASIINDFLMEKASWKNQVFGKNSSSIQGINPGIAKGTLQVLEQYHEQELDPKSIYVFRKSPADLQPVAGILSISEGNLVSHLQLLARNLGIPNANISEELFTELKKYQGKEVFFAVSNQGGLIMKLEDQMTTEEVALFSSKKIDEEIIKVPVDEMNLSQIKVYSIKEIDASSSGILCGPKAANFAKLKKTFPDQLVDGLVIPFAVFKDHMTQKVPGENYSYWEFLTETFVQIGKFKSTGVDEQQIEKYTFERLALLREMIKKMPLKTVFVNELETKFEQEFSKSMGNVPVFLRSDTNMEDLKDFTGAGLNLTIFNTIEKDKIWQGIKDVWASPYSERSYRWRQKFLTNPEDVYPSILIIPSVFVDYSGVIITKDFIENKPGRLNLAFSQGAGGAVDGQKSESWILSPNRSNILVSPARDRSYKYLSKNGGTANGKTKLSKRLLSEKNKADIWKVCEIIYREMPPTGMFAPYDIELGFENDKLWLFQIRPFVENKKATSSNYLNKLDPIIPKNLKFNLNDQISI